MISQWKEQQTRSLGTDCSHLQEWSNAKDDDSLPPHLWTLEPCPSWFPLWLHVICGVQESGSGAHKAFYLQVSHTPFLLYGVYSSRLLLCSPLPPSHPPTWGSIFLSGRNPHLSYLLLKNILSIDTNPFSLKSSGGKKKSFLPSERAKTALKLKPFKGS